MTQEELKCPKCNLEAHTPIDIKNKKFIIYKCPKCLSNVVYYNNKFDIISDKLLGKLAGKKILEVYGYVEFNKIKVPQVTNRETISIEDITNLRILLETEKDFSKLLSKL